MFVFLLILIPISLFGEIIFPESVYLVDNETGFKIMLGLPPSFIENEYGPPKEKSIVYKYPSGNEEWRVVYTDFIIKYHTHDMKVTYIGTMSSKFSTPKVKIGDSLSKITRLYGNPVHAHIYNNSELLYLYSKEIPEINTVSELTTIQFGFINNRIIGIYLYIVSVV